MNFKVKSLIAKAIININKNVQCNCKKLSFLLQQAKIQHINQNAENAYIYFETAAVIQEDCVDTNKINIVLKYHFLYKVYTFKMMTRLCWEVKVIEEACLCNS